MLFSGYAEVREWYDDGTGRFRIDVSVSNPTFGSLFGYRGSFDVEWVESKKIAVPDHLKPSRTERRE